MPFSFTGNFDVTDTRKCPMLYCFPALFLCRSNLLFMKEYDYRNREDRIKRIRERRMMILRMADEEREQADTVLHLPGTGPPDQTGSDPLEEARQKLAAYLEEKKGMLSSLSELPLSGVGFHLYVKISGTDGPPRYYHMSTAKTVEAMSREAYEVGLDADSGPIYTAADSAGHTAEMYLSGAQLEEVTVNAYDTGRLELLRKFASNDEGFWGIFYNYPEKEAALLFASLNPKERDLIKNDKPLLKQLGNKLDNAQYARGLEKLDFTLDEKLDLLWEGRSSFSGRGIELQDLRGLLLSSGTEGKELEKKLRDSFDMDYPIRIDFLLKGKENLLDRLIKAQAHYGKPRTLLFDDKLDNKDISLYGKESKLVNTVTQQKKTESQLTEDEKNTFLHAFERNALKVTYEMLDLSEKTVIQSSDKLLKGEAASIKKVLNAHAGDFNRMNELDRQIRATYMNADPKSPDRNYFYELRANYQHEKAGLEGKLREELSKNAPILKDPKIDLQGLYNNYAGDDTATDLEEHLREHLADVFANIQETRRILHKEPEQVYKLESVVTRTKELMALPDVFDKIVDEKVSDIQWNETMLSIGMAVVSIGLAVASFGTLTPFAAGLVAAGSFAVSGVDFYYTAKNYSFEKTTGNTSIDPEQALSFSDPSFIWVIASFAGAVADLGSVVKLLKPAKLIDFGKTGTGGSEIASDLERAGKLSKGYTVADIIKMLERARDYKTAVKKQLLQLYSGKYVNLKELDELADIYLAEKLEQLKKTEDVEALLKKDVAEWHEAKVKNIEKETIDITKKTDLPTIKRIGKNKYNTTDISIDEVQKIHGVPKKGTPPNHIDDLAKDFKNNGYNLEKGPPIEGYSMPDGKVIIIDGHHRLAALEKLGEKVIPIRIHSSISDEGLRLYLKIGEYSGFYPPSSYPKGFSIPNLGDDLNKSIDAEAFLFISNNF